jgi:signal recognition particle GTPase
LIEIPPMTLQQRAQQKRQERLDDMRQQVKKGTLVIRKMTPEERRRNPPRERRDIRRERRS